MSLTSQSVTSGFIDLATYDEMEKYMYNGPDARAYFVRDFRKSNWFTQIPVPLQRQGGQADFGQDFTANISRAGDYLLHTWLRFVLPKVTLAAPGGSSVIRWTPKVGHAIIEKAQLTFNELVATEFDSYFLDFWAAFTTPAGKYQGYANMIGDTADLTFGSNTSLPSAVCNVPLPFFFTRDSGVSLPTAALPYNEMKIHIKFRKWEELLVFENNLAAATVSPALPLSSANLTATPTLGNSVQVWANYAIVSNTERKNMGCAPRSILIEQVQRGQAGHPFTPNTTAQQTIDIRFSHAIKVLFFGVRNVTHPAVHSNYTSASHYYESAALVMSGTVFTDPVDTATLSYENTHRLSNMPGDYYTLVNPWYSAPVIAQQTGYHQYSYSLNWGNLDPMGSTNYGKLTNVSLTLKASADATLGALGTGTKSLDYEQKYEAIVLALNNNMILIKGGSLGFPVI